MGVDVSRLPRTVELARDGEGRAVLTYVDQRLLPERLETVLAYGWEEVVDAVRTLAVRGAPALGICGAAALSLWADQTAFAAARGDEAALRAMGDPASFAAAIEPVARRVAGARPTAVNLSWGVRRAAEAANGALREGCDVPQAVERLFAEVKAMEAEDERACRAIGEHGADLLPEVPGGCRILTHCNAGSLACSFFGTALGVVYAAAQRGRVAMVYADETRPVGQGARLTAWELARAGVPVTLICDDMAASAMASGMVDAVVVGADRIAANGDVANKIGTLGVAVLAHRFGIPFYVAAPTSTVDLSYASGADIPIEQRDPTEVMPRPIEGVSVWNPAFDVTPARLVVAIVTEKGAFAPGSIADALG